MIEAADLRIDNWVQDEHFRTGVVKRVAEHSVSVKMQHSTLRRDSEHDFEGLDIEPIELTEDILIKCGFVKGIDNCFFIDCFFYDLISTSFCWDDGSITHFDSIDIKYLHQLQNLFYCLTGKELEITL